MNRPGRKAQWPEGLLNDLVDIIVNDEYFRKKLILTNTKSQKNYEIYQRVLLELKRCASEKNEACPYTAIQLRTKFKKSISECKKAAMLMKYATGIKRFQEERGYGTCFQQFFSLCQNKRVLSTRASN